MSSSLPAQSASPLLVENAWIRKPPPGLEAVALYFTARNPSKDRNVLIIGVRSSLAAHSMIHESSTVDGQSRMRMKQEVSVPGSKSVTFAPGGLHVMLMGLRKPLEVGDEVPV